MRFSELRTTDDALPDMKGETVTYDGTRYTILGESFLLPGTHYKATDARGHFMLIPASELSITAKEE